MLVRVTNTVRRYNCTADKTYLANLRIDTAVDMLDSQLHCVRDAKVAVLRVGVLCRKVVIHGPAQDSREPARPNEANMRQR